MLCIADSAEKLVEALQRHLPGTALTFIFGASNDHPIRDMLAVLLPHAAQMFVTASPHPRAEKPESLVKLAAGLGYTVHRRPNVAAALTEALAAAGRTDVICVAGSLFLVADARETWLRHQGRPLPPIDPLIIS